MAPLESPTVVKMKLAGGGEGGATSSGLVPPDRYATFLQVLGCVMTEWLLG